MARARKTVKVEEGVEKPRVGVVSNLFKGGPEAVAGQLDSYGLESVQILPDFPELRIESADDVTPARCKAIAEPFLGVDLRVAGISAHTNFLDSDRARRKRLVKRFDALIAHCQDFGTEYVITETATLNTTRPWEDLAENHRPEAFDAFVRAIKPSVELAEKAGVTILLECHLHHVVGDAAKAVKVREHLGPTIGFVMDPPNFMTKTMVSSPKRPLRELFEAIGAFSPVAHGKDIRYNGGEMTTPRAGTGSLDYKEYLELLGKHQPGCPLILEQIVPAELRETLDFLDRFFGD